MSLNKLWTTCGLGFIGLVLATGSDIRAQSPVGAPQVAPVVAQGPIAVPVPVPVPIIAQTQETLSARTLVRLEQLTRELSETIGRVEALEAANIAQKGEIERLTTLIDLSRANQVPAAATDLSAPAASQVVPATAATAVAETALFTAPMPPPISPAIMLTNAQTALQSGAYPVAEANLTQLIWVYPASAEASEGRWLLGEARFVQASWGSAAQAYVDYLKASPQGPRASEALLRLAGAFRQLGDNRQRCVALAEFKRRAPRPDATLKARADGEIARMTCPAV